MVRFLGKIRNERHAVKATHLTTTDLAALDDDATNDSDSKERGAMSMEICQRHHHRAYCRCVRHDTGQITPGSRRCETARGDSEVFLGRMGAKRRCLCHRGRSIDHHSVRQILHKLADFMQCYQCERNARYKQANLFCSFAVRRPRADPTHILEFDPSLRRFESYFHRF